MRQEMSPVAIAVVVAIVVVVLGLFLWKGTEGKTFTKDSAHGEKSGLPTLTQTQTH